MRGSTPLCPPELSTREALAIVTAGSGAAAIIAGSETFYASGDKGDEMPDYSISYDRSVKRNEPPRQPSYPSEPSSGNIEGPEETVPEGFGQALGAFAQRTNVKGALIAGVALLLGLVAIIWALMYRNKVNRSSKPAKLKRAKKR